MSKTQQISFQDYKSNKLSITDVSTIILDKIPIEQIFTLSDEELAFEALSLFNFKKLSNDQESIKKYAQKVMDVQGLLRKTEQPIMFFVRIFLKKGADLLKIKNALEAQAKAHLRQVEDILNFYSTLDFIRKYIAEPISPRSNEERKQLDFYKRANQKKAEIISYLLDGILHRALDKASPGWKPERPEGTTHIFEEMEKHEDFPYLEFQYSLDFSYGLSLQKLDFRLISPLINKMDWLESKHLHQTEYTKEINDYIETYVIHEHFFDQLLLDLDSLPVIRKRKMMFEEMIFLFKQEKWYALYALALPQVEGIFSEMLGMLSTKRNHNSLTDKVYHLRNAFELAHYTFDYYQYTLADQRNSFSHIGKVDEPKIKCFHLLMDIAYLLRICTELDTPLSKLAKVLKEGKHEIKHIGNFAYMLGLVKQIEKDSKYSDIQSQLEHFIYKEVLKHIKLLPLLKKLEKDFVKSLEKFGDTMAMLMRETQDKHWVPLLSRAIKDIKPKLETIELEYNRLPILVNEDMKILMDTNTFLTSFVKYFPKTPKSVKTAIDKFKTDYAHELKNIHYINSQIKLEIPEDFILAKRRLEHLID